MARPLRMDLAGAFHHVMSRGNAKQTVFHNPGDYRAFTQLLGETCERFRWTCHAHCLMPNHYHLLVETHEATLARGMKHLNGVFTQRHNTLRQRVGHLFQGRYKALLVDSERYLLELARYIVLNPVRARLAKDAASWRWSSARWLMGTAVAPEWADPRAVWGRLAEDPRSAAQAFVEYLGHGGLDRVTAFGGTGVLGDERFRRRLGEVLEARRAQKELPRAQRFADRPALAELLDGKVEPERIRRAVLEWGYTQAAVAKHLGVSAATVSRAVRGQVSHLSSGPGHR